MVVVVVVAGRGRMVQLRIEFQPRRGHTVDIGLQSNRILNCHSMSYYVYSLVIDIHGIHHPSGSTQHTPFLDSERCFQYCVYPKYPSCPKKRSRISTSFASYSYCWIIFLRFLHHGIKYVLCIKVLLGSFH